jgi:hypothetical protein
MKPCKKQSFKFQFYNKSDPSKRTYNNIVFDSVSEKNRFIELEKLQKEGVIYNLERQPEFLLQETFRDNKGNLHRSIKYISDFMYSTIEGETIVEDVKSKMTCKLPEYRIKKKLFIYKYPQYTFFENIM